jgi:hypothetical protein
VHLPSGKEPDLLDVTRLLDRVEDIFNLGHKVRPQATARSGFI